MNEQAKALGAVRVEHGINWSWAMFKTEAQAREFVALCNLEGFEHRGVYPPHRDELWGVRFR